MKPALIKMTVSLLFFLCYAGQASASSTSYLGSIDAIDHTFASGGGTFSGTFSSATDDDWLVFDANSGDMLTITSSMGSGLGNFVLLQDTGDGSFAVGDAVDVLDLSFDRVGDGDPLQILACVAPDWSTSCETGPSNSPQTLMFEALYTGQYGVGITVNNEFSGFIGPWSVSLSGNTPLNPVPVPAAVWLFGTALIGFIGLSRRRKVA